MLKMEKGTIEIPIVAMMNEKQKRGRGTSNAPDINTNVQNVDC
jgi:hypothetical protein